MDVENDVAVVVAFTGVPVDVPVLVDSTVCSVEEGPQALPTRRIAVATRTFAQAITRTSPSVLVGQRDELCAAVSGTCRTQVGVATFVPLFNRAAFIDKLVARRQAAGHEVGLVFDGVEPE